MQPIIQIQLDPLAARCSWGWPLRSGPNGAGAIIAALLRRWHALLRVRASLVKRTRRTQGFFERT